MWWASLLAAALVCGTAGSAVSPVWKSGYTPSVVDWYFRVYTGPGRLGLSYMQNGQENSFGWKSIGRGLPYQIEQIARLRREGKLAVKIAFTPGQIEVKGAVGGLADAIPSGVKTFAFNGFRYPVGFMRSGDGVVIDLSLGGAAYAQKE